MNATVDDTEVSEIKIGDQAVITPSGATTSAYGTVGSIGLLATSSSGVASFPVVINVTGSPTGLFGGATAGIAITLKDLQGVVVVPTAGIHYSGNATTVNVISSGSTTSRTVRSRSPQRVLRCGSPSRATGCATIGRRGA